MELENALVQFGTEAIQRYRKVTGYDDRDNELPEQFLRDFIGGRLRTELHLAAHKERQYTTIARELGVEITTKVISEIGLYRADIAIYEPNKPTGIIELKRLVDESVYKVTLDQRKMVKLQSICNIDGYLGVLVTDTSAGIHAESRIDELETALGCTFTRGTKQPCGNWHWYFVAAKIWPPRKAPI